jgi:hypothetical protein
MLVFGGVVCALASIDDEPTLEAAHSPSERIDSSSAAAANADIFGSYAIAMDGDSIGIAGQLCQ